MLDIALKSHSKDGDNYCRIEETVSIINKINGFGITSTIIEMTKACYLDMEAMIEENYTINPFWFNTVEHKNGLYTVTLRPSVTYTIGKVYMTGNEYLFVD